MRTRCESGGGEGAVGRAVSEFEMENSVGWEHLAAERRR